MGVGTGSHHGVELRDNGGTLCQGPVLAPGEFVEEVAEGEVVFFLAGYLLDGELELALDSAHEEVVDDDVVGGGVQLVLYSHKFEGVPQTLAVV